MTVIFDPATAAAISRCLTARSIDPRGVTARHPRPCGWCIDDLPTLRSMLEGFNAWATVPGGRHEVRQFEELERHRADEAEALVVAAQAFPPEPEPVAAAPAPAGPPPAPSWLGGAR